MPINPAIVAYVIDSFAQRRPPDLSPEVWVRQHIQGVGAALGDRVAVNLSIVQAAGFCLTMDNIEIASQGTGIH